MRLRILLAVLAVAIALLASSCGGQEPNAACKHHGGVSRISTDGNDQGWAICVDHTAQPIR